MVPRPSPLTDIGIGFFEQRSLGRAEGWVPMTSVGISVIASNDLADLSSCRHALG